MFRKIFLVMVFSLFSVASFAIDKADFNACLNDLAEGISQTAYSVSERENSAERQAVNAAEARADKAEDHLKKIISNINNKEDFSEAEEIISAFAKQGKLNSHTAAVATKHLKERVAFINANNKSTSKLKFSGSGVMAKTPEILMSRRGRRMIMTDVPVVEAALSLTDTKEKRRIKNLNNIFDHHGCRVISNNTNEDTHTYYFSGKKYVIDALLGHFGGSIVKGNLKAVVTVTAGGFWAGKQSVSFNIAPTRNGNEMGELSWYKSVVENDPFKYLVTKNLAKLATIGKYETIAGEKKLLLKNTTVQIWVIPSNGTTKNAIYTNSTDFGDKYVDLQ